MIFHTSHTYLAGTLITLLTAIFCISCSSQPEGVLSADEMEDILYEIHRAEGIMYVKGYEYGHYNKVEKYYGVLLQKNGITQAQFDSSLVWYTDNPTRFNKIYPKVIDRLTKDKDVLAALNDQNLQINQDLPSQDILIQPIERSVEQWLQIMHMGLPIEWGLDSTHIDTAFVYPYLTTLQDSIQQKGIVNNTIITDTITTEENTLDKKEEKTFQFNNLQSSKKIKTHRPMNLSSKKTLQRKISQ